jgi:hypothetical protein
MCENKIEKNILSEANFLWRLFLFYFVERAPEKVSQWVSSMYENNIEFKTNIENKLLDIWSSYEENKVIELVKESIKLSLFGVEKQVYLIAHLLKCEETTVNDASHMLRSLVKYDSPELIPEVRNVLDVAWLINEDEEDNIMLPEDDDVLKVALVNVLKSSHYKNS